MTDMDWLEARVAGLERREQALLGLLHDYLYGSVPANAIAAGLEALEIVKEEQEAKAFRPSGQRIAPVQWPYESERVTDMAEDR